MARTQSSLPLLLATLVVVMMTQAQGSPVLPPAPQCLLENGGFLAHPTDCSAFYYCSWGRPYKYDCPADLVWSEGEKTCVYRGSEFDDCTGPDAPTTTPAGSDDPCSTDSSLTYYRHDTDCSKFYQCSNGHSHEIDCLPGLVFSVANNVCVWPYQELLPCGTISIADLCEQYPTAVFPHPTECHQFINCSLNREFSYYFPKYVDECYYPELFDAQKLRCEDFDKVSCGNRRERVNGCDYSRNRCPRAHCIPCWVYYPSCEGLSDGDNVYSNREWSPWYAVCKEQRLVDTDTCDRDERLNMAQFFSPYLRRCISLYEVPREHGGLLLDCTGKADGHHPDDVTSRPNLYYTCLGGQRTAIELCEEGMAYGSLTQPCVDIPNN